MEILYWLFIVCVPFSTKCNEPDPCSDKFYRTIRDLPKRSPLFTMNAAPLCDNYLSSGWYGAEHYTMPTSPPSLGTCGTLYPVWLNVFFHQGKLPTPGEIKEIPACKVGFRSNCSETYNIKVKNCETFIVYQLGPLGLCASAYCFQLSKKCVDAVPSNLLVSYHSVSWDEDVQGTMTQYTPSFNLNCNVTPLQDRTLYYDIFWYEGNEAIFNQTLAYDSLDKALLSSKHISNKQKKSGSLISCLVGAKYKEDGIACRTKSSPSFFAGIRVLTTNLTIERGGTADVQLLLTVPFAEIITVLNKNSVSPPGCLDIGLARASGNLASCRSKDRQQCGIAIKSFSYEEREKYSTDAWEKIHIMKIYKTNDLDVKTVNEQVTLRLETGNANRKTNRLFDGIFLQDIQVYIKEPSPVWKEKHCGSYTDPHMLTFDGYKYECQEEGTFILYNNRKFNQEVQVKHHRCHARYSNPRCTCAVAARSGRDIFTVNICYGTTFINFPLCDDRAFKVIRKNDKYYQVLFPTGTLVEILIVAWPYNNVFQIDVKIFPSPPDVGNTNGLCGVLDGAQQNDLTRRDGNVDNPQNFRYHSPPRAFFRSWRILASEDLFSHSNIKTTKFKSVSDTLTKACTCEVKEGKVKYCGVYERTESRIDCSYGTVENCKFKRGNPFECSVYPDGSKRKKRDLSHLTKIMEIPVTNENQIYLWTRSKRQIYDVRTEKEAEDICIKAFEETDAIATCRQYDPDISNTAVHNCISDVMMTGDNNITKIHIEAALEQCSSLVLFNSTFQEERPEVTHIIESLCPNNCSGNGECHEGNCTCEENFAGSDCSFDLLGPPSIKHISDFGFCDKSYEECDEITLYGELFLEKMNTYCYITRRTIQLDGTHSEIFFQSNLEPRTLFEGYCPLSYSTEFHWMTEFTFNVSNDGVRFTDSFNVYIFQSDCQEYKNISGNITFSLKSGYCFIKGRCYIDGGTNRDNQCDMCNVTQDRYSWSFNPDHCLINDKCYMNGEIRETNPCSACLSSVDKWNWSNNPGYCYIDGICYFDDQTQKNNDCYKCNYTQNRTEWTFNEGHCLIDDQCYKAGASHVISRCLMCDPIQSRTNWTLSSGYCFVNDLCIQDGESEENNPCLICNISVSIDSLKPNPAYCDINGLCVAHALKNEEKSCLYCNTSINRGSWSLDQGYCFVNDSCIQDGKWEENNPCLMCNISTSRGSLAHNPGYCDIDGFCVAHASKNDNKSCLYCNTKINRGSWSLDPGFCFINDSCMQNGVSDKINQCFMCNTSANLYSLSPNLALCYVDDICVANGQENDIKSCFYCNTTNNRESWSLRQDFCVIDGDCIIHGSSEKNKDCRVCDAYGNSSFWQIKDGHCYIQETCFKDSEVNTTFPCQICNSSREIFEFSSNEAYCNIDGLCVPNGSESHAKACLYCNTSLSRDIWSFNQENCMINGSCIKHGSSESNNDCRICDIYTHKSEWQIKDGYCYIRENCFKNMEANVSFPCKVCNSYRDVYEFSPNEEYCNIDDSCIADGQKNDAKPCLYCNTSLSMDTWSFHQEYCIINGTCIKHGSTESNKDCRICDAYINKTVWQIKDAYCNIGDLCVAEGEKNKVKSCLYCNTSISREDWTFDQDFCMINGVCIKNGSTQQNKDCRICDVHTDNSGWQIKEGHCYIQDTCYKDMEVNKIYPCHICNAMNDMFDFSSNTAYCNIGDVCMADGQRNNVKNCLYCNISLTRGEWSLSPGHCLIDGLCVNQGRSEQGKDCKVCDSSTNKRVWKIRNGHCFIKESCFKDFEKNPDIHCQFCNSSNNVYEFSTDTDCLSSTEGKVSQESIFSNPIFIATVSLIAAVCVITIVIIVIYKVKMKVTGNWSIRNEARTRGNVGLTLYKKVNTEDLPPPET